MLSYVEEIKKYVDEMSVWDGRIRVAKNELRKYSKFVSKKELEEFKSIVKGNVAFKIRSYIELCAYLDRSNVFYGKEILNALPDYKGEGYALVAEKWQKDIFDKYIRKNTPMTQNIEYLVDMSKLFEKSTHKDWVYKMVKSPFMQVDRQDISGHKVPICWRLLVDSEYVSLFANEVITSEELEKYILDGKCVLLQDLHTENGAKAIDKKYIFDMSMDCKGNSVYERLYPNLRSNFWECYNQRIIEKVEYDIENKKDYIRKENACILWSKKEIENKNDDIAKLNEILEK